MTVVPISYFSDVLCIWAYIAQLRVDAVKARFGEQVRFEKRFCTVFGDTRRKMEATWGDKGGYAGFNAHLRQAAEAFPEVRLNPNIWLKVQPASSDGAHLFLKAVQLAEAVGEAEAGVAARATWAMRCAFFEEARDIGDWAVQREVGARSGVDCAAADALIGDGRAFAALSTDYKLAAEAGVQGSPSFVLNQGRQKLYGNVGFRIIEANISELLRAPKADQASWC